MTANTSGEIRLSVCIPVYGVEPYIEKCAHSLLSQTIDAGIEYLFVDDCSPDASCDVLRRVVSQYSRRKGQVRIIRHSANLGLSAARKTAYEASSGRYVTYCDSDDWIEPEMYERLLEHAEKTGADLVWTDFIEDRDGRLCVRRQPCEECALSLMAAILDGEVAGFMCNKLFRRQAVDSAFVTHRPGLTGNEDVCYLCEFLAKGCSVSYCARADYHYVQRGTSLAHAGFLRHFNAMCEIARILESVVPEANRRALRSWQERVRYDAVLCPDVSDVQLKRFLPQIRSMRERPLGVLKAVIFWSAVHGLRGSLCLFKKTVYRVIKGWIV